MEEDGSRVEGLIPKIQDAFDKYTKGVVSVIDKQNGGLNSTYEILEQLSKVYPTLSDEAKAYINEVVAGNRQNKVLVSILENWENVEGAVNSATNSLGSANAENEKYLNSIAGKLKQLESAGETFWKNLIDSEAIKTGVDGLTSLVEVFDKLINNTFSQYTIQAGAISTGIMLLISLFNKFKATVIGTELILISKTATLGSLKMMFELLATSMLASPLFWAVAGTATIMAIVKAVDYLSESLERQQAIVESLSTELRGLQSEYEQLSANPERTAEQEYYLKLLEKEIELKKESLKQETTNLVDQKYFTRSGSHKDGYQNLDSGADEVEDKIKRLAKYRETLEKAPNLEKWNEINAKVTEIELELIESLKDIKKHVDILGDEAPQSLVDLAAAIESLVLEEDNFRSSVEKTTPAIEEQTKSLEELTKEFENASDKINSYQGILDELNSKEGLSAKSKQDIVVKYQELLPYLHDEQALRQQLIKIIEDEGRVQNQVYMQMMKDSEEFYNAKIKGNAELVNKVKEYYGVDLSNYKTLADAKLAIESQLLNKLTTAWSRYYNAQSDSLTYDYVELQRLGKYDPNSKALADEIYNELVSVNKKRNAFDGMVFDFAGVNFKGIGGSKSGGGSKSAKEAYSALYDIYLKINQELDKNNVLLAKNKSLQELADDDLSKKIPLMEEEIELNKQRQQTLHELNNERRNEMIELEKTLSGQGFTFEGAGDNRIINNLDNIKGKTKEVEEQFNRYIDLQSNLLPQASQEWWNLENTIKNITSSIDDLIEKQKELARQNWIKEQNDLYDQQQKRLQALESIQERIVAIIRKRGEEEKRQLDEAYNKDMEQLEERHSERKKKYADELDEFKKLIQGKLDALDEQYEEEDYQEQLNKEREEANRLQAEIDVLSLDDSLTARNKTIELRKQLADQNEKIAKMQQKKERDTLKKSLEDQLKDKEKQTKDIEKIADNSYNNEKRRLEEDYRINKEYLEKKYSDEQVYSEAREAIMRGEVEVAEGVFMDIYDAFEDFEDKFGKGMGILGDIIKNDFINQLKLAQDAIDEMDYKASNLRQKYDSSYQPTEDEVAKPKRPSKEDSTSSGGKIYMSSSDFNKYINYKLIYDMAKSAGNKAGMDSARAGAQAIRDKYGIVSDKYSYDDLKNRSYKDVGFVNGGKITETGTLIAPFHGRQNSPEWIFNDEQLKKIISEVSISSFKTAIPKIPNISAGGGNVFNFDSMIEINGNVDERMIPKLKQAGNDIAETIKNLNKGGVFRPVKV